MHTYESIRYQLTGLQLKTSHTANNIHVFAVTDECLLELSSYCVPKNSTVRPERNKAGYFRSKRKTPLSATIQPAVDQRIYRSAEYRTKARYFVDGVNSCCAVEGSRRVERKRDWSDHGQWRMYSSQLMRWIVDTEWRRSTLTRSAAGAPESVIPYSEAKPGLVCWPRQSSRVDSRLRLVGGAARSDTVTDKTFGRRHSVCFGYLTREGAILVERTAAGHFCRGVMLAVIRMPSSCRP